MRSKFVGKNTLDVEVTQIDTTGIWVLSADKEYFLPFEQFPLFREATIGSIHNVEIISPGNLRWPQLGIELALESVRNPENVSQLSK